MKFKKLYSAIAASLACTCLLQAESDKKHLTIVVGTHHYSPQRTMPELKKELERLGFEVSIVNPDWDPEKDKRGLPGLEVLADTDLAIFFTRFLKLEGEQYNQFMGYVESGKPVVGLRTSGHGFNYPKDSPKSELNNGFGRDVLGSPYLIHLAGKTQLNVIDSEKNHPILTGISGTWSSPGTLYLSKTEEGVKPLILGTGSPKGGKAHTRTNQFGTHELQAEMTDKVAWTWNNKYGGKTFYTSLGHAGDFSEPNSMRLIVNGIHWAVGVPVPSAETEIKTFTLSSSKKAKK
ncbi:ThuA domain-containing protein [Rubritalea spongiae]|uniref:ThuA domain-containing protein n=1 Tax=Rubritalea spongiae TaxID=430797 RepID=A0ABW5E5R9_9BACT